MVDGEEGGQQTETNRVRQDIIGRMDLTDQDQIRGKYIYY